MKAMVYYEFGSPDVIQCVEIEKPVPSDSQVLVRVRAAALNPVDSHLMKGASSIVRKIFKLPVPTKDEPGRLGRDVAGVVEAVGKDVTEFKPGDEVFGCALGACAEYVCASEAKLVRKPENVTFEEAATGGVAALTALQGLRDKAHIKAGDKVLINGAAGGVGTFAVQIAKADGAEVTAVCSAANLDLVRSIGADYALDYRREDFTKSGKRYDILFDLAGNHSLRAYSRVMVPKGTYLGGGILGSSMRGVVARMLGAPLRSKLSRQTFTMFMASSNKGDLETIGELMATGKVKPVIDRRYELTDLPEAMRYLDTKRARGKLVILVD
jgi:NADPH:quinone reductase-like Zn-dependent oxidoreductase